MRDAEGLVKIEMRHVGAVVSWTAESHLGVHVGTVQVDLTAKVMDHLAEFLDAFIEDAIGRWVRHHDGTKPVLVLVHLHLQVGKVDASRVGDLDGFDTHAGHLGTGRVGSMGGSGDEANLRKGNIEITNINTPLHEQIHTVLINRTSRLHIIY